MPSRVLVIRRRYLGDLVLLGAMLRNLRLHWPDGKLVVLTDPGYGEILGLNPDVDAVWDSPAGVGGWLGFVRRLRAERFTHVFNLDNTERTALIARLSGAQCRVGLHHGGYRLKLAGAYTAAVNHDNAAHESSSITEYYLAALAPAGVPVASREVRLLPRALDLEWLRRFVGGAGPVLLVHPGSRSPWRVWPVERFAAVCDRAQDELNAQVVLVGGPAEKDAVAKIKAAAKTHLLSLDQSISAPRFAALASLATAMLCHDSGPMHVAAAVGTPVVALYGSQNAVLFRPAGEGHRLIQPPLPCQDCDCVAPTECVKADSYRNYCVRRNSVETVYAALADLWPAALARKR